MNITTWAFFTRYAEMVWMINHPWAFLVGPAVVGSVFLVSKLRNR